MAITVFTFDDLINYYILKISNLYTVYLAILYEMQHLVGQKRGSTESNVIG